jgi:hypothetical protein
MNDFGAFICHPEVSIDLETYNQRKLFIAVFRSEAQSIAKRKFEAFL